LAFTDGLAENICASVPAGFGPGNGGQQDAKNLFNIFLATKRNDKKLTRVGK
jgi:hypothetical protein